MAKSKPEKHKYKNKEKEYETILRFVSKLLPYERFQEILEPCELSQKLCDSFYEHQISNLQRSIKIGLSSDEQELEAEYRLQYAEDYLRCHLTSTLYFASIHLMISALSFAYENRLTESELLENCKLLLVPALLGEYSDQLLRGPGRREGSGRFESKEEFEYILNKAIDSLHVQGRKITQEAVADILRCHDEQLRAWLRRFGVSWKSIKKRGKIGMELFS